MHRERERVGETVFLTVDAILARRRVVLLINYLYCAPPIPRDAAWNYIMYLINDTYYVQSSKLKIVNLCPVYINQFWKEWPFMELRDVEIYTLAF